MKLLGKWYQSLKERSGPEIRACESQAHQRSLRTWVWMKPHGRCVQHDKRVEGWGEKKENKERPGLMRQRGCNCF